MRIAIDMDEVLADTAGAQRRLYRELFGYDWSDEELRGVELHDLASPEHRDAMFALKQEGHVFGTLPVIAGAVEAVQTLAQDHEVFIATAAMEFPASCMAKVHWMARHFPFIDPLNIMLVGHKSAVAADVLIDDRSRHFPGFPGQGVLFAAMHNVDDPHTPRLERWADAPDLIADLAR